MSVSVCVYLRPNSGPFGAGLIAYHNSVTWPLKGHTARGPGALPGYQGACFIGLPFHAVTGRIKDGEN